VSNAVPLPRELDRHAARPSPEHGQHRRSGPDDSWAVAVVVYTLLGVFVANVLSPKSVK
jgi:hypothetical protein